MSRFRAAGIHLGLSFLIFIGLAYLILFHWYPDFFFATDGGWRGMRIIIFVDLVLGPSLTLVVYKHGKPGLRTDLTLIGVVQIACLLAGTYVVYSERPLAIVYNDSRFSVLSADDYLEEFAEIPDFSQYQGRGPKWLMVELPEDLNAEADFRAKYFAQGKVINMLAELYRPFDFQHKQVLGDSLDMSVITIKDSRRAAVQSWLAAKGGSEDDYLFYNITARYHYGLLVFDKKQGKPAGVIPLTE